MFKLASAQVNEHSVGELVKPVETKCIQPDRHFDVTVDRQWPQRLVRTRAEQPVAQRQSAHEHRQHDRLRLDCAPEHQREVLRPHHLVNQSGDARAKEKEGNQHTTANL